ncbi:hypothetical protein HDU76_008792 [Blyttiomyces sp. JEL0837]|nr:hypothetical protein HDU76_008792 [Blyttiomyces sp. JEL0837]
MGNDEVEVSMRDGGIDIGQHKESADTHVPVVSHMRRTRSNPGIMMPLLIGGGGKLARGGFGTVGSMPFGYGTRMTRGVANTTLGAACLDDFGVANDLLDAEEEGLVSRHGRGCVKDPDAVEVEGEASSEGAVDEVLLLAEAERMMEVAVKQRTRKLSGCGGGNGAAGGSRVS